MNGTQQDQGAESTNKHEEHNDHLARRRKLGGQTGAQACCAESRDAFKKNFKELTACLGMGDIAPFGKIQSDQAEKNKGQGKEEQG